MKFILCFILFLSLQLLPAQNKFSEGYYISAANDTIHGLIKISKDRKTLTFKNHKQKSQTIEARAIIGCAIDGGKQYWSIRAKPNEFSTLLEITVNGHIVLCYPIKPNPEGICTFYLQKKNDPNPSFEITHRYMVLELKAYMSDDPEIWKLIENKEVDVCGLPELVQRYNKCYPDYEIHIDTKKFLLKSD